MAKLANVDPTPLINGSKMDSQTTNEDAPIYKL